MHQIVLGLLVGLGAAMVVLIPFADVVPDGWEPAALAAEIGIAFFVLISVIREAHG